MQAIEKQSILDYVDIVNKNKKHTFAKSDPKQLSVLFNQSVIDVIKTILVTSPVVNFIRGKDRLIHASILVHILSIVFSDNENIMKTYNYGLISKQKMKDRLFKQIDLSSVYFFSKDKMTIFTDLKNSNNGNVMIKNFVMNQRDDMVMSNTFREIFYERE